MPYKPYNQKESNKEVFKPPAISGSSPVAPNKSAKPFPTPFAMSNPDNKVIGDCDSVMADTSSKDKDVLHRTSGDGKVKKNKRWDRKKWKIGGGGGGGATHASVRRMVFPKSPWVILEELAWSHQLELNCTFLDPVEEEGMTMYPCEVTVNGEPYHGTAPDQEISQNIAAEMAIQSYVVHAVNSDTFLPEVQDPLDRAPWAALASLGLFKLFNDWQSHGFAIPMMSHPRDQQQQQQLAEAMMSGQKVSFEHKPCKRMPDDPTSKHPVQLINEMYPGNEFMCCMDGDNYSTLFKVTVTIDGQEFYGEGRSKKDAKKECAMAAAKELLNIDYYNVKM